MATTAPSGHATPLSGPRVALVKFLTAAGVLMLLVELDPHHSVVTASRQRHEHRRL